MRVLKPLSVLAAAIALVAAPNSLSAQDWGLHSNAGQVTCASEDGDRHICRIYDLNESSVRIERRLSNHSCINGQSWGTGEHYIWVDNGCRAQFTYDTGNNRYNYDSDSGREHVTCESEYGDLQNCYVSNLNERSVKLERKLSDASCINGRSWGTQPNLIWVESGCRASFSYTTGSGSGGNSYNYSGGSHVVTCESDDGAHKNCYIRNLDQQSVRLVSKLSDSECVNGRSWGTQSNRIWVQSGCRAIFSYKTKY